MAPSALAPHRRCTLPRPSSSARATHPPQPAGQCSIQHRHAVRASAVLAPLPADDRAFPSISGRLLVIGLTHDEDGPAPREALLGGALQLRGPWLCALAPARGGSRSSRLTSLFLLERAGAQGEQHQQQDLQAPVSAAAPPSHLDDGLAAQQDGATGETPLALHAAASPSPSSGSRWPPPKPGDEVVGTVVFTNSKGCMVRLRGGQFVGHMPASQGPMLLPAQHQHQHHHHHHQHAIDPPPAAAGVQGESSPDSAEQGAHKAAPKERYPGVLPLGVSRRFVVMSMPTDGRGPLLSAALADQRVIMARAQQLKEMLWQVRVGQGRAGQGRAARACPGPRADGPQRSRCPCDSSLHRLSGPSRRAWRPCRRPGATARCRGCAGRTPSCPGSWCPTACTGQHRRRRHRSKRRGSSPWSRHTASHSSSRSSSSRSSSTRCVWVTRWTCCSTPWTRRAPRCVLPALACAPASRHSTFSAAARPSRRL